MSEILIAIGLASAAAAGLAAVRSGGRRLLEPPPILTVACCAAIGAVSLLQLTIAPGLLTHLMRDGRSVVVSQPWRLVTSLLVQDGGWPGALFNLTGLLVLGTLAERLLGRRRWAVVASLSVGIAQVVGLAWQPIGAGNSILDFGLAGAICAAGFSGRAVRPAGIPAGVAFACFVMLLVTRDIHGAAAVTGALVQFGSGRSLHGSQRGSAVD